MDFELISDVLLKSCEIFRQITEKALDFIKFFV